MLQDTARRIAKLKIESKLPVDETEYVNSFDPAMMKVAYEWCKVCAHDGHALLLCC